MVMKFEDNKSAREDKDTAIGSKRNMAYTFEWRNMYFVN